jgi:hypothetical protein
MKPVAITFGRMNPPTIGHQKLVDHLHSIAKKHGADAEVHLSHTQDSKKNPLSHGQKVGLARKAFGSSVQSGPHKTIIDVMKHLHKQGRKEVHVVVGGDRHKEMHELLHKYNGKDYHFDKIHVHSAGDRDPDAEGAEGMSASKMREHAKNKNHEGFKSGLPEKLRSSSHRVMKMVRSGMGHVEEGDPFGGGTSAFTPADREMPQTAVSMQHEEDPDGPDEPRSSEAIGAHEELNHKLFVDERLMPEVRIQLRKIADQFIRFVAVPLDVKDIVFTGSNASYHYTDHSDIDLHVVVKLKGGTSMRAYMRQLFDAKKSLWNQMHNITIRGFEVELYIEPTEEPAVSSGVYSIQNDKWVKHPTNQKPTMDDVSVRSKYRQYKDEIDAAIKSNDMSKIGALLAELREMRSSGLAKGGEYSVENIVYKLLRSRGDLQKLWSIQSELGDKELSLEGHRYYSGLDKSTASKRKSQFKRQTKMSDNDPSAYKAAPGDSKKTKTSVHTMKYRRQFGDNYNANDVQFNPPELPVRYSYLSASYNKRFEQFAEAAGYRDMFRGIVPHGLDPTTEPLSHAVPTSRYDLESADSASKLVQDKHRREKETLAKKHERERESMRMQDLRKKMMQRKSVEEAADQGLAKKAEKSGIPVSVLRQVYNRGMAAWKTGHRPGANQQQWAYARVNSFITKGKGTWGGADKDLAAKVRKEDVEYVDEMDKSPENNPHTYGWSSAEKPSAKMNIKGVDNKTTNAMTKSLTKSFKDLVKGKMKKEEIEVKERKLDPMAVHVDREHGDMYRVHELGHQVSDVDIGSLVHKSKLDTLKKSGHNVKDIKDVDEACWDGYKAAGMKKKGDRMVPNCVPEAITKAADFEYKKEKLPDGRVVYRKVHKKLKVEGDPNPLHRETGTDSLVKNYKKDTPGQNESANDARYMAPVPWAKQTTEDSKSPKTFEDVRKALAGLREQTELSEDFVPGIMDAPTAQQLGIRAQFGYADHPSVEEDHDCECGGDCQCDDVEEELEITEAEYQGRKVTLNKPFRTPGGPKKSAVYTTNGSGNVVLVRFGDPNMTIKKNIPGRRRNFRARHNCDNPGPRWKARYWSCRAW